MPVLDSAVARLMFLTLTVAVGLVTMRTQSDVWLGVLVATAAAWGLLAVGAIVAERRSPRRVFWGAFLVATTGGLLLGFGPWSDRGVRGSFPRDAASIPPYLGRVYPSTVWLLRSMRYVPPTPRAEIQTYDGAGRPVLRIVLTGQASRPGDVEQFLGGLDRFLVDDIVDDTRFFAYRSGYFTRRVVVANDVSVYLNAGYLLAALALGAACGWGVTALDSVRPRGYVPAGDRDAPARTASLVASGH